MMTRPNTFIDDELWWPFYLFRRDEEVNGTGELSKNAQRSCYLKKKLKKKLKKQQRKHYNQTPKAYCTDDDAVKHTLNPRSQFLVVGAS